MSALAFLALGIKGYVDNENRLVVVCSMVGLFAVAVLIALIFAPAGRDESTIDAAIEDAERL